MREMPSLSNYKAVYQPETEWKRKLALYGNKSLQAKLSKSKVTPTGAHLYQGNLNYLLGLKAICRRCSQGSETFISECTSSFFSGV